MPPARRRLTAHQRALLGAVQGATDAIAEAEAEQATWVRQARAAGVTVDQIKRSSGLTRQAIYDIVGEEESSAS